MNRPSKPSSRHRGWTRWSSTLGISTSGWMPTANRNWCRETRKLLCIRQQGQLEEPCRTSVQSISSVLHRHVGESVFIAIGRSSGLSDRGHHVPALTVTSGGRGRQVVVVVPPFFSLLRTFSCIFPCCCGSNAQLTLRQSLKPTVASSAERSRANF